MNFSSGSSTSRNHLLRAGLQGTKFSSTNNNTTSTTSTPIIVKPEFLNLTATNITNTSSNNNNSNNNNNDNNLKNSPGPPTYLTISKSRVPDITMINKYYGLVPKKFVINARSDFSSKSSIRLRPRTTQSFDCEETTESLLDENLVTKNRNKEVHENGHNSNKNVFRRTSSATNCEDGVTADVNGLVARRMPVEKHKKLRRIKNCGRSLSMMDNCESMGSMGGNHSAGCKHHSNNNASMADRMEIQRVIKIDLNHMQWEENYHERCKTECADTGGGEEDVNDSSCEVAPSPTSPPTSVRRGFLRKTISFDDQIMRTPSADTQPKKQAGEKADLRQSRRPTTALPSSSSSSSGLSAPQPLSPPAPPSTPKVTPWTSKTGQSLADRRSKFQKSFSIYQDSFDNGESDNEPESCEGSSILSASIKCRESKKSLHVQAPPEISTMISLISPPPPPDHDDDLQAEIDKVDSIINTCHNRIAEVEEKLAFDEVPTISAHREKEEEHADNESKEKEGKVGQELLESNNNNSVKPENIKPDKSEARKTATTNAETSPLKAKKILKKAASISCENELVEPKKQVRARPQTSRPKNTVSFSTANSTRYIPSRRENSTFVRSATICKDAPAGGSASSRASSPEEHNTGSRNRKILIKKALIEINQSSINLGKKGNHVRPKTAPMPDKKSTQASTPPVQKRQPLKASPPMKIPSLARNNNSSSVSSNMELQKHTTTGKTTKEVSPEPEPEPSPPKVRVIPRKSLSMTDGFLHGFGPEAPADIQNSDIVESLTNSKKREECLKVYEKMLKKGCNVKLETIFRGLMTPSEYRMFVQAKELAEKKAMEEAEVENINPGDAGISSSQEDSVATS